MHLECAPVDRAPILVLTVLCVLSFSVQIWCLLIPFTLSALSPHDYFNWLCILSTAIVSILLLVSVSILMRPVAQVCVF